MNNNNNMNNNNPVPFVTGLIAGAIIGGLAGLLFAPQSGVKTRQQIKRKAKTTVHKVQQEVKAATKKAERQVKKKIKATTRTAKRKLKKA